MDLRTIIGQWLAAGLATQGSGDRAWLLQAEVCVKGRKVGEWGRGEEHTEEVERKSGEV